MCLANLGVSNERFSSVVSSTLSYFVDLLLDTHLVPSHLRGTGFWSSTVIDLSVKDKKHAPHGHGPSKLTSRQDLRKRGVTDGRVAKKPGIGQSSRHKSSERSAKEPKMLVPTYIYEGKPQLVTPPAEESKQKDSEDTSKDKTKSAAPLTRPERYNELSPLMTTMVEDELKNIMIKIWQILPDDASSDAEKLVLDKLKGAAGDDLRNTIGLNVTKRLLNVHNGILVKIVIFSAVTPSETYAFAKKYHIVDFKHVQRRTYAGRLRSWTHLDELYTHKSLRCGKSSVTITPIYNFLKCPTNLRTVFDGEQNYSDAKKIEKEAAKNMTKHDAKAIVTADKVLAEKAKKEIAKKDNSSDKSSKDMVAGNRTSKDDVTDTKNSKNNVPDTKNPNDPAIKKVEARAESKNTQSANKGTTETAKNTVEKSADKTDNKQSESPNVDNELTTQSNESKTQTKVTKVDKTKIPENKTADASNVVKKDTKVEPAKAVVNKPSVINTPKAVTNTQVPTNTKAAINTPKVATNIPQGTPTPKKVIVPAKPENKPDIKTMNVEPSKAPVKEVTKSIANPVVNKPTTNSAKKETAPKPSAVKRPEAAKVDSPKAKELIKTTGKPTVNIPKPKLAEIKKIVTKVVPKPANKSPKDNVKIKSGKVKKNESDFDELSDRDILALLSSGIVLDECSGSDVD